MAQDFYLSAPVAAHHVYVGAMDLTGQDLLIDGKAACYRLHFAGGCLRWPAGDASPHFQEGEDGLFTGNSRSAPAAHRIQTGAPWCTVSPSGDALFMGVSPEGKDSHDQEDHLIVCYRIDRASGALEEVGAQMTGLLDSTHCSVDPSGGMLVSAQTAEPGLTSFPLRSDGTPLPAASVIRSSFEGEGSGAPSSAEMAIGGRHVLVPAADADTVWVFELHPSSGTVSTGSGANDAPSCWEAPRGSGPRRVAVHPNGLWVYVLTEMGCSIELLSYSSADGTLQTPELPQPEAEPEPGPAATAAAAAAAAAAVAANDADDDNDAEGKGKTPMSPLPPWIASSASSVSTLPKDWHHGARSTATQR